MFDTLEQKHSTSNRSKIPIRHELKERLVKAKEHSRFGDWEADTIVGFNRKSGLLTLVDRKSRFLKCEKLTRLGSREVFHNRINSGNAAPMRILTASCASIFLKATILTSSVTSTCKRLSINLISVRENVWVIKHWQKYIFLPRCTCFDNSKLKTKGRFTLAPLSGSSPTLSIIQRKISFLSVSIIIIVILMSIVTSSPKTNTLS